jgi:PST family polysaccharide transporter
MARHETSNDQGAKRTMRRLMPAVLRREFNKRAHLSLVASNAGWLVLERALRLGLGLLLGGWVARYLGPDQFGELAYVIAFCALFGAVANLGLDNIVVREIAEHPESAAGILGSVARMRLLAGIACWTLTMLTMAAIGASLQGLILTSLVAATMLVQPTDTLDLWFQSQSQIRRTVLAKLCATLVSSALKIGLILLAAPLLYFGFVVLFEAIMIALALMLAYRRFAAPQAWHFDAALAARLLKESWPFALSAISVMVYMRIDQVMLKHMLGNEALGLYAAALPLSQAWNFIPMTLSMSLAPLVARKRSQDHAQYLRQLVLIFRLFFWLGLVVSVMTAVSSGMLMTLLYGEGYREGASLLRVHVFTNVFIYLGVAHSLWVVNERRSDVRLWGTVVAGAFTVLANALLIPRVGTMGVVWVSVAAQFIAAVGINCLIARDSFLLQLEAIFCIRIKGRKT